MPTERNREAVELNSRGQRPRWDVDVRSDPERVEESRMNSTLSGSDGAIDSDPVALPPAIKFVRCANLKRLYSQSALAPFSARASTQPETFARLAPLTTEHFVFGNRESLGDSLVADFHPNVALGRQSRCADRQCLTQARFQFR